MEQNETTQQPAAGKTDSRNDLRTFLIAFLTSITLIALYHFGTGIYAIFSGASSFCSIPVTREYVLVPVSSFPVQQPGGHMMPPGPRRGFGRPGMSAPGQHHPRGNRHAHSEAPAPAGDAPAPAEGSPAPAPQPPAE